MAHGLTRNFFDGLGCRWGERKGQVMIWAPASRKEELEALRGKMPTSITLIIVPTEERTLRDDGWPLCPSCNQDELWCQSSETYCAADHDFRCYVCGWAGSLSAGSFYSKRTFSIAEKPPK